MSTGQINSCCGHWEMQDKTVTKEPGAGLETGQLPVSEVVGFNRWFEVNTISNVGFFPHFHTCRSRTHEPTLYYFQSRVVIIGLGSFFGYDADGYPL